MKTSKVKLHKNVHVKLIGDAKKAYEKLNKIIGEQKAKGITSSTDLKLWNSIQRTLDLVKANPFYGENAKKNIIPI